MRVRHVIVDRDGVLNRELPARAVTHPADWAWEPRAREALARLTRAGIAVSVVTNQSQIGRGGADRARVDALHRQVMEEAERAGGHIDEVLVCPHRPDDGCACRKPSPALVLDAMRNRAIPTQQTILVGDDLTDLEAGRRAGIAVALVRTGKGRATELRAGFHVPTFEDLLDAVDAILAGAIPPDDPADAVAARVGEAIQELRRVLDDALASLPASVATVAAEAVRCLRRGGKILACGNGGSAADAEHFAAELIGRFGRNRRGLPAIALTGCSPVATALANDRGYEEVFARQVEALSAPGDLLLAISTSGRSENVLRAVEAARRAACRTGALTGSGGGPLVERADVAVVVPSAAVARVQEVHAVCLHAIAEAIEATIFPGAEGTRR